MKKVISLFFALVITAGIAIAETKINPDNIKNDNDYTNYVDQELFDKTPTAFSYVKRQIKYKVVIDKAGKIKSYEVLDSSGSDKYDAKVKEAITNIALPPFPKNTKMSQLTFTYDVEKRMNVKVPVTVPVSVKIPGLKK